MKILINLHFCAALITLVLPYPASSLNCDLLLEDCDDGAYRLGWQFDPTAKECRKVSFQACQAINSSAFDTYEDCMASKHTQMNLLYRVGD